AASALLPTPTRHDTGRGALVVVLRADGFEVQRVERGDVAGAYLLTFTDRYGSGSRASARTSKVQVRTTGSDVRAELREFLARSRSSYYRESQEIESFVWGAVSGHEARRRARGRPVLPGRGWRLGGPGAAGEAGPHRPEAGWYRRRPRPAGLRRPHPRTGRERSVGDAV